MKLELLKILKEKLKKNSTLFLMPGHKRRGLDELNLLLDTTESYENDNLNDPKGVIKRSETRASNIFKSKRTFYTVNGSTGGIISSIFYATKPNDTILIARNCHISVLRAAIINRLKVEYINTNYIAGIDYNIDFEEFKKELIRFKPKAVVITHPNYFGYPTDILKIVALCNSLNILLIVDEAHGAHFNFSKKLPISAVEAGADIVIESTHKMLTGLTQTALVHVASDIVDIDNLFDAIKLFQTTSPSYILTASNEMAVSFAASVGREKLDENIAYACELNESLKSIDKVHVLDNNFKNNRCTRDPLKIVVGVDGLSGDALMDRLYYDYNIECEMNDGKNILLLATLNNKKEDYDRVLDAIKEISNSNINNYEENYIKYNPYIPKKAMEPYEAYEKEGIILDKKDALNQISKEFIAPYPPGIPIYAPGEIIDDDKFLSEKTICVKSL